MQTLSADEIGKSYRGRRVVSGVSFHVKQGEVVGLLGPNGAGKTTSFYIIVGLIPADTGRVLINGQDITDVPMYLRARNHGISYLPQEPSIFRKLTVEDNILAVLEAQPMSWHERRERMERLIDQLGLGSHSQEPRLCAVGGRAAPGRDCALPVHLAVVHFAGRTLFRNRSHRGTGFAENHLRFEGEWNRSAGYRS